MTSAPTPRRVYPATVVRWIDADTVVLDIDQGFDSSRREHIRLNDCWAPELDTQAGLSALLFALKLAPFGTPVVVETFKPRPETLDRYLGIVWANGANVADALIELRHATRTRSPKEPL